MGLTALCSELEVLGNASRFPKDGSLLGTILMESKMVKEEMKEILEEIPSQGFQEERREI
jgi:hypothetical protein